MEACFIDNAISHVILVNIMSADALAPCVARSSAGMVLTHWSHCSLYVVVPMLYK